MIRTFVLLHAAKYNTHRDKNYLLTNLENDTNFGVNVNSGKKRMEQPRRRQSDKQSESQTNHQIKHQRIITASAFN